MGVWNPFVKKDKVSSHSMVGLTPRGKQHINAAGGKDFAILSALEEQNPSTMSRIAEETNMDLSEIQSRLKILSGQGLVTIGSRME